MKCSYCGEIAAEDGAKISMEESRKAQAASELRKRGSGSLLTKTGLSDNLTSDDDLFPPTYQTPLCCTKGKDTPGKIKLETIVVGKLQLIFSRHDAEVLYDDGEWYHRHLFDTT